MRRHGKTDAGSGIRLPVFDGRSSARTAAAPVRRWRPGRWRAAVLLLVHVLIALHVAHGWRTGSTLSPLEPSEAMELGKHGVVNAGAVFFALTILTTALFGRFFCGWACHVVALQDASRWLLLRLGLRPKPLRSRALRWVPAVAFAYMFLWPFAYRVATGGPSPRLRTAFVTSDFWATFPGWAVAAVTFLVCGFVAVWLLGAKGFCTYACPYGAIFAAADRVAPLRVRVTDACAGCGRCTAVCSSNVRVHTEVRDHGQVVDPGCMKCLDCVSACPNEALYLGFGRPALGAARSRARPAARSDWSGWEELAALALFALAFASLRGLYGVFPFLLTLGLSAVLAFAGVHTLRLARKPSLSLHRWPLKRSGRLRPAGWFWLAALVPVGALWVHSGVVQLQLARGRALFAELEPRARALLDRDGAPATLSAAERRRAERARASLGRAHRIGLASDARTAVQLAWLSALLGDDAAFAHHAADALRRAPGDAALRVAFGDHHARQDRPERARELYEAAIAVDPAFSGGYVQLGLLEVGRGDAAAAGAAFARGLEALPDSAELSYNAALVDAAAGRLDRAIERLATAVALAPDYLEARENLAGLLCAVGRYGEGIEHYERALAQSPGDPVTHLLLARARLGRGDLRGAAADLERATELAPNSARAWALLGDVRAATGDRTAAAEAYERARAAMDTTNLPGSASSLQNTSGVE